MPNTTVLTGSSPGPDSQKQVSYARGGNGRVFSASLLLRLPQDLWEEGSTGFATKSLCISFLQEHRQLLLGSRVLMVYRAF